uniref:Uncharacterized protein n=1 Tax=viral metagenome TaxID=1070528 RepID=A0A6C0IYD9_9ZZZZ
MSNTHTLTGAMQDGRFFTNYSPVCKLNSKIANEANIQSWNSTEYRNYLQKNGLALINSTVDTTPCGTMRCEDNGLAITPPQTEVTFPYTEDPEL